MTPTNDLMALAAKALDAFDAACSERARKTGGCTRVSWYGYTWEDRVAVMAAALASQAERPQGGEAVDCPWNDDEGEAPAAFPACRVKSVTPPHWALPAVENALNLLDHYGYMHTDLAAVRDWLKEST